ncbi:MAG: hypothetical protein ABI469_07525 [Gemmatimonadales bacterium]
MVKHLYLAALATVIGCAAAGGAPGEATPVRRGAILTADEIAAAHADVTTAYDAVVRLRPNWLAARGPGEYAKVFLDGNKYGELDALRNIPGYQIASAHYYDATQSSARFGLQGGSAGAIDVTTKTR